MSDTSAATVLVVTRDRGFLSQVRAVLPLAALVQRGKLAGFRLIDPLSGELSNHYRHERFDAVVLQRETSHAAVNFFVRRNAPFLYDIDDLLVHPPAYSRYRPDRRALAGVALSLVHCRALGVTSDRLTRALERRLGLTLSDKARWLPNASPRTEPLFRPAARPRGIFFTSSDLPALTVSARAVFDAVEAFSIRRGLPVYTAGDFPVPFTGRRDLGVMDYWRHKHFLACGPALIGAAPLETRGDADTLEFIACKSDVKMAEYAGAGHAGVYSLSPPYAESDLCGGPLVENTRQAWIDALEAQYDTGWRQGPELARAVWERRNALRVAERHWLPALAAVRLERPFHVRELQAALAGGAGASVGEPLHHRLADLVYHGLYTRLVPDGLKRRVGRLVERLLEKRGETGSGPDANAARPGQNGANGRDPV
ncbi:hypothetical protein JCM15519_07630 [Fundidesulfovibrio butyratiphilus]